MKRLVMAATLTAAALAGLYGTASAFQLLPPAAIESASPADPSTARQPVQLAQTADPAMRVLQLEEEIRGLNGRIEEMSFQLLQMQEQIRKYQEDNEFRFQEIEKGGIKKSGALETPVEDGTPMDSVAEVITQPPDSSGGLGAPEQTLGAIQLDASGMPVTATINTPGTEPTALPGVETPAAPNVASLDSESDVYQAAYGHVLSGDYVIAEGEFRDFIARYPESQKVADANFWLGEAQYSQGNYNDAAKTFLNAHQTYGSSPKAPEMLLKLGMSMAALENNDTACAIFREVSKRYPKASRAVVSKVASEQKRLSC